MWPDPKLFPAKTDNNQVHFDSDICNITRNSESFNIEVKDTLNISHPLNNDYLNDSIYYEHCCAGGDVAMATDLMCNYDTGCEYYPQGQAYHYSNNLSGCCGFIAEGGHGYEYYPQGNDHTCDMSGYCGLAHYRAYGYEYYPHYDYHCNREGKYGHMLTNQVAQIHNIGVHTNFEVPMIRIYDSTGTYCYAAMSHIDHQGHLTNMTNPGNDQTTMSVTNHVRWLKGNWATVVYLHGGSDQNWGYHLYIHPQGGQFGTLIPYVSPVEAFLQIIHRVELEILPYNSYVRSHEEHSNPKLAYSNYCEDIRTHEYYGCTYEKYMLDIIDSMLTNINPDYDTSPVSRPDWDCLDVDTTTTHDKPRSFDNIPVNDLVDPCKTPCFDKRTAVDFNYPDKTVGYLNQAPTDFTFIGPDRAPVEISSVDKLLQIADVILSTGVPNYRMARIPVKSGLNVEAWEHHLRDYADKRVIQYIRFGYPLSLHNPQELCNKEITNHFSACQYPSQVQSYLDKESKLGALLGPVNNINHDQYHCSPLLTRPKDTDKRRVILNLSHPHGHSVNDHVNKDNYDSTPFILKFPTIDDIVRDISNAVDDTVLFKVDVARAFRNLRVDPADALKLGIRWKDAFYVDLAIAFGWTHGSGSFQILSDAIAHIMARHGVKLHCYIDDYIVVAPKSKADAQFATLCELLKDLGLPLNRDKVTPPTKKLGCLGIDIDINTNTMSIAQEKLREIYEACIQASQKTHLSRQAFQSLLGKLIYIHKCVKPSRIFINRILELFRKNHHCRKIYLNVDFHRDLQWFLTFLPTYNGISYITKSDVDEVQSLYLDACLTGMGAVWRDRVYATPIHNCGDLELTIVHLEMMNIVIALRIWGQFWQHGSISVNCDNLGVVQVVKTSKTRDPFLALCIRNIWLITSAYDIDLNIKHIPGVKNVIADTLSRIYSDKPVNHNIFLELKQNYKWDRVFPSHFDLHTHL